MPVLARQSAETVDAARAAPVLPTKYVPVSFARLPDEVLSGFPLYMRNLDSRGGESFTLYASAGTAFTPEHRRRLYDLGAAFLYIPTDLQKQLRRRLEEKVETLAANTSMDLAARCEVIYETAIELLDDTFTTRDMREAVPRLRRVAAAIVTLHLEDPLAFTHFFLASRHDACAATHA